MGRAKAWMMEMEERGFGTSNDHVCAACVEESFLKEWIDQNAQVNECSFCGAKSPAPSAASFEDFAAVIVGGLAFDWNEPTNEGIMYISAEGGWQAPLSTTSEVLWNAGISDNDDVVSALDQVISCDAWVERELYYGTESERLEWGWESFKAFTKNNTRYFFLQRDRERFEELSPGEVLATVADMVGSTCGDRLIKRLEAGTDLTRIRVDREAHTVAAAIGTPRPEFACQPNRMSPAGIPMFYGAFDVETARAETVDPADHAGQVLSVGTFRSLRDLIVLDLAELPPIPSAFDLDRQDTIHPLRFLHAFAADISQPIARDRREHIEYVPTQIVTEYFRRVFRLSDDQVLDGLVYRSAKLPGRKAVVLFVENSQCVDEATKAGGNAVLSLAAVAHEKVGQLA